jgi:hypothetical protein
MLATANASFTSFDPDGWTITWDAAGTAFLTGWFAGATLLRVDEDYYNPAALNESKPIVTVW